MNHSTRLRSAGAAAVLSLLFALEVSAAPPSGSVPAIVVGGPASVFLPVGHSEQCDSISGLTGCLSIDTVADGAGGVTGSGMLTLSDLIDAELPLQLVGQTTGTVEKPKSKLNFQFAGPIDVAGITGAADGSGSLKCAGDPLTPGLFNCDAHIKFCLAVPGVVRRRCVSGAFPDLAVQGDGGPFELDLTLATDAKNKVSGSGRVTLKTGQQLDYVVSGKYSPKIDASSLKLTGTGLAKKATVSLKKFTADAAAGLLKFKLGGQKGSADLSTLP
jgi:hypothetical protein